ncbi:T9SS type A sorting domain-containing protein [uncultured Polaribacter sp.]|uniref:InlB B-repeat-containing protein n=1 Tax=uncultured Polaribacter sp. TaxID=174711 RepID=UPI0026280594|nr:T9SS type A sorting domain-containing protein [uncultured Polaribacter sp.]
MKLKLLLLLLFVFGISFAQIPTNGLKAYYKLENLSGADVLGLADLSQTGAASVSTSDRVGTANTAITLNGDSFSRSNISYPSAFNDFSISFWVKTATNTGDFKVILDDRNNPAGFGGSSITVGSLLFLRDGKISFRLRYALGSNTGIQSTIQSDFIADDNWHHITVVSDQLKTRIYTDNRLSNSAGNNNAPAFNNRLADPVGNVIIAQNATNNLAQTNQYQDALDDILFYDRVLTQTEIENIGNNNFCFPPSDSEITITNVTENSATVNWVASGTYDIAYGFESDSFANYTTVNGISGNSFSLQNLDATRRYSVYIRQQCSSSLNSNWNTVSFATSGTVYVNANATGNNNGSSFADAYTDLNTAITNHPGEEIWIAAGTYIPEINGVTNRSSSFIIPEGTELYGGFNGTETQRSQRDFRTNTTILSGDINGNDDGVLAHNNSTYDDNSFQVVTVNENNVVLDGLTIKGGNANGTETSGSALTFNHKALSLNINNVIFEDNRASAAGTVYANNSVADSAIHEINFKECVFKNNIARFATVIYVQNPLTSNTYTTSFINTLISNNFVRDTASNTGTNTLFWFRNDRSTSNIAFFYNCTITKNRFFGTNTQNAGIISSSRVNAFAGQSQVRIYNSIIWDNLVLGISEQVSVDRWGTFALPGNVQIRNSIGADSFSNWSPTNSSNSNPLFTDVVNNDFTLQANSPAIDAGDNNLSTATTDLLGNSRIFNGTIDIGPYEFGSSIPMDRTLTITATNGSVSANPTPVNGTYDDGTVVTLTATPDAGYKFVGWSGDATGTTNPLNITMDANKSVTALFSRIQRTLTITATNGSVSTNPSPVNGTYDDGTVVTLTATPDAGYQFDGWSGDVTGTTNPLDITMDADKSVTALFSRIQRTLTITATNGTVSTNPSPVNGTYDDGTVVTLTATPDAGYQFDGFRDDISGANLLLNSGNRLSTTITLNADKSVTALFSRIQRSLTITATNGSVSTNPSPVNGTYDDGTVVTLIATPDAGYQFDGFRDDISGANLLLNSGNRLSTTITLNADKSVTALFSRIQRSLTITAKNGSVSTNPNPVNGTYDDGTVVTLTATPNAGFALVNWTIDGATLDNSTSGPATSITVTMNADKTVAAVFDATASVDDEFLNSFNLYPNPTNNVLNISTDLEIKDCKVYNVIGKKVLESKSKEINVTNLPKGMYLIQIITAKGKSVTKKFVKK